MSSIRIWRTSSFAVRNDFAKLVFSILVLVFGAAFEEMLPHFWGVGLPILLIAAQYESRRSSALLAMLFAIAAGGVEDAISNLPMMASASYFLLVAILTRWAGLPRGLLALTYPGYQIWLRIWVGDAFGNIFNRILISVPVGILSGFAVVFLLAYFEGKAAVDEE